MTVQAMCSLTIGGTFAYVNGSPVWPDAPAFIDQGRTYVAGSLSTQSVR